MAKKNNDILPIVGIGASAGGLAALKKLLARIPEKSGIAYVVVIHLSPEHKSVLAELLQPHVKMPVVQVTRTLQLKPDHVFVIPPNANLNSIDTHLRLSKLEEERNQRAPIDHFFHTLSRTHNGHCAGIILTGTGSDGTLGIKEIKKAGGLIIVQDPDEAEYNGMPASAIQSGQVDMVLPLAEIPSALISYLTTFPELKSLKAEKYQDEEEDIILQKIFALVRNKEGKDFSRYKSSTVFRRIQRRMQINQVVQLKEYLVLLLRDPEEAQMLAEDLLINVTSFFRESASFDYLGKEIIPRIFRDREGDSPVRVWSVGCATGEEAYSIAMLLLEEADKVESAPEIQIFASDLHESSLKAAREGFYPGEITDDVSPGRIRRFFTREDTRYRIKKEVREKVIFTQHNVLSDPPFSRLDMIVCRNLLIYLKREVQSDLFGLFHYALSPGGYLFLGSSENVEEKEMFRTLNRNHSVYVKKNVAGPELSLPVFPQKQSRIGEQEYSKKEGHESRGSQHHRIIEKYGPPAILLNAGHDILHVSGRAGRYLKISEGDFNREIFRLLRPELQTELRSALYLSKEAKEYSSSKPVPLSIHGEKRLVSIHARLVEDPDHEEIYLVHFHELKPSADEVPAAGGSEDDGDYRARIRALEQELQENQQKLHATIREYKSGQEEMKVSNEELQSTNEELRSTLEELETSKEELQSLNEELSTLNQENKHRVEELGQISSDLHNFLVATDIATLFLDRHLRIVRFTPALGQLFNVRPVDLGRPVSDLTNNLGYLHLPAEARKVLNDLQPIEHELTDDQGRSYLTRLLPYRSHEDKIEGVVISFIDISERKSMENELRESENRFRALVNATSYAVYRMNSDWSEMRDLDGHGFISDTHEPTPDWMDKYMVREEFEKVKNAISEAIRSKSTFYLEHRMRRIDGSVGWTSTRAVPIQDEKGEITGWFGASSDISDRKRAEESLHQSELRRLSAFEAADVGDWWLNADTREYHLSPKVRDILGIPPDGPEIFRSFEKYIHPGDREKIRIEIEKALDPSGMGEFDLEFRVNHPDGTDRWVRSRAKLKAFPMDDSEEPHKNLYGAMTDITDQKKMLSELIRAKEEAEKAAKAKEDFLAHISHEIRTPLHAIVGLAHLLIKQEPKKAQLDNLHSLKISAENLSRLINDVLDFSKIESGKFVMNKEPFWLRQFVEKIVNVHATIAREKKLELETRIDSNIPEWIVTDQMILSQVLHNLLSNAVKFTPEGKVELEIRHKEKQKKKHLLQFSVTDTGIGIPADKLEIIFEVFSQADSSTIRHYGGSGLGLAITKRYLEMLGSRIMVESISGKGSRFYFTLAAAEAKEPEPGTELKKTDGEAAVDLKNIRGLVVEDDPYNRLILKQLLNMWDLKFDEAENGLQAVEKAKEKKYQIILLDVHMPVMDGFDAARNIRELPGYSDTAIIALTADISDRIRAEVKTGLFTEVHIKPFEPEKINRRITEIARRPDKSL